MQQVQETVGMGTVTGALIPGFYPEGVSEGLIDAKILALVDYLLPKRIGGRELLAHLLRHATLDPKAIMQFSLFPEIASDEAVTFIKSVAELAKSPSSPAGAESYHKMILILEALEIIKRRFSRKHTEIHIRMARREISLPDVLARLKELLAKYTNPKVRQLAKKVMKKLQSGDFLARFGFMDISSEQLPSELEPVKGFLQALLRKHGLEGQIPALQQTTKLLAAYFWPGKYALDGPQTGDFLGEAPVLAPKKGRFCQQKGDLFAGPMTTQAQTGDLFAQKGDLLADLEDQKGDLFVGKSPFPGPALAKESPNSPQKGDFVEANLGKSPEFGQKGRVSDQKGDSFAPLSVIGNISSSEFTLRDKPITDTPVGQTRQNTEKGDSASQAYRDPRPDAEIRAEAQEYAELIDEKNAQQWMRLWIKRTRNFTPQVRLWAAIDTFYHTHYTRKADVPGMWFNGACERFTSNPEKVSPIVKDWAATTYDLKRIKEALRDGYQTPASLSDPLIAPTASPQQDVPAHSPLAVSMTREQAEALRDEALRDGVAVGEHITAEVRQYSQGGWYVATRWDGIPVEHSSPVAWHTYFTDSLKGLELKRQIAQRK